MWRLLTILLLTKWLRKHVRRQTERDREIDRQTDIQTDNKGLRSLYASASYFHSEVPASEVYGLALIPFPLVIFGAW